MNESIFLISLISIILLNGCLQQQAQISERGALEGKIIIGPLCPVYRGSDKDPRCQPTEETYNTWPITVYSVDENTKVAQLKPNSDGNYKIELPAGKYRVVLEKQSPLGAGSSNLPAIVTITSGKTTAFNITIDTGIR